MVIIMDIFCACKIPRVRELMIHIFFNNSEGISDIILRYGKPEYGKRHSRYTFVDLQ